MINKTSRWQLGYILFPQNATIEANNDEFSPQFLIMFVRFILPRFLNGKNYSFLKKKQNV